MASTGLKKSFQVDASHGEVYTGGPIAYHHGFRSLITPQQGRVNTLPLHTSGIYVFPIAGVRYLVCEASGRDNKDDSKVTAVAAHAINGRLAVAYQSGFIRIYEPELKTRTNAATQVVEAVDAVVERANVRYIWKEIGKVKCENVSCLAWDNLPTSAPLIAAACADSSVKVFDQLGCYITHNLKGHTAPATFVKFDRNSNSKEAPSYTLFSASVDCTVRVWSLTESKQVALLKNHMSPVTDIDFINHEQGGGRKVVTVGRDQIISVYHMTKGFPLYTTIPVYENLEACIVLDPKIPHPLKENVKVDLTESANVLVVGTSGVLKIWNTKTAQCVFEQGRSNAANGMDYLFHIPPQRSVAKPAKRPSVDSDDEELSQGHEDAEPEDNLNRTALEDLIVGVSSDQNMLIHSSRTMEATDTIVGYNDEIIDAAFVTSSEVAVATNSTDLRVFSIPSFSSRTFGFNDTTCAQHKEPIMALAISPCKQFIVTASKDQTILVWSIQSGRSIAQLTGHTQSISTVQFFNRTSRYIVSGGRDMTWKIWDIGEVVAKGHQRTGIDRVAGSILTVKAHNKDVNCLAVAPNDAILASGGQDKDIKLFSIDKVGKRHISEYGVLRGHRRGVWDVAFSPVDQILASCSADMTIKLWNLKDFTCIKTFEGHTGSVLKVRFLSNGLQLLSSGADGLVKLWNIHDNECVNTFDKHSEKIWALAVDPKGDGSYFVTGGGDSMLCLWKDNTEAEEEAHAEERDEIIAMEQSLSNFIRQKKFRKALKIALKLDKPFQALRIIEMAMTDGDKADTHMTDMIGSLDFEYTQKLLTYVRDWNTNAKNSLAAQTVLYYLFNTYKADSMTKFPLMKDLLQALIPYSVRHFQRLDRLLQASYILDYTLEAMNLLPDVETQPDTNDSATVQNNHSSMNVEETESSSKKKRKSSRDATAANDEPANIETEQDSSYASKHKKKRKRSHSKSSTGENGEDE